MWAVLVPESLAYASIAGLPPVVGLYAAVPALVLYALAGSSRHLIVGPMSATAALSAAIIMPVAHGDSVRYLALSTALAICAGLAGMLAALLRLGFIASFISEPVLKGFIVGLALTIIIGQVPKLLGVEKTPGNFFEHAWGVIKHMPNTDPLTLLIGASSLILVLALRRWWPSVPGSLRAVLLGIGVVTVFGLADQGVKIVGHIDSGLPAFGLPTGVGWRDYVALFGPAIGVVLIGFAEGLGAAKTYAAKAGYQVNANRELAGLGAANLGSGQVAGQRSGGGGAGDHHLAVPDRAIRVAPGSHLGRCCYRSSDRTRRHSQPAPTVRRLDDPARPDLRPSCTGGFRGRDCCPARGVDLRYAPWFSDRYRGFNALVDLSVLATPRSQIGQAGRDVAGHRPAS